LAYVATIRTWPRSARLSTVAVNHSLPISRISPLGFLHAHLMFLHVVNVNDKLLNVKAATATTIADAFVISLLLPAVFSKRPAKANNVSEPWRQAVERESAEICVVDTREVCCSDVRARTRLTHR
jgi:hypothetical protein